MTTNAHCSPRGPENGKRRFFGINRTLHVNAMQVSFADALAEMK
jgi:hypothetical protein